MDKRIEDTTMERTKRPRDTAPLRNLIDGIKNPTCKACGGSGTITREGRGSTCETCNGTGTPIAKPLPVR